MTALVLLVLSTYHAPVVTQGLQTDTGMGECKRIDQHFHTYSTEPYKLGEAVPDGLCHRNGDDSPIFILPKVS